MRTYSCLFVGLAICLAIHSPSLAQQKFDPAARAAQIQPFLDDSSILVVHVDLERFDFGTNVAALQKTKIPVAPEEDLAPDGFFAAGIDAIKAQMHETTLVVSMADYPRKPFLVARLTEKGDPKLLLPMVANVYADKGRKRVAGEPAEDEDPEKFLWRVDEQTAVFGPPETLARLKTLEAKEPAVLARAFQVAGDTTAQAIVVLNPESRKGLAKMIGPLPPVAAGITTEEVLDAITFIAAGFDAAPSPQVRYGLQATDAASAERLHDLLKGLTATLKESPEVPPAANALVDAIMPLRKDDRLYRVLNADRLAAQLANFEVLSAEVARQMWAPSERPVEKPAPE